MSSGGHSASSAIFFHTGGCRRLLHACHAALFRKADIRRFPCVSCFSSFCCSEYLRPEPVPRGAASPRK